MIVAIGSKNFDWQYGENCIIITKADGTTLSPSLSEISGYSEEMIKKLKAGGAWRVTSSQVSAWIRNNVAGVN